MGTNCFHVILKAIENIVIVCLSLSRSLFSINHRFHDLQPQIDGACSDHRRRRPSRDDVRCCACNKHRNIKNYLPIKGNIGGPIFPSRIKSLGSLLDQLGNEAPRLFKEGAFGFNRGSQIVGESIIRIDRGWK